jgi:hypothetical protein
MKKFNKVQQGDVILNRITELPKKAVRKNKSKNKLTLAYGEATGHSHVITDPFVEMYEHEGVLYLSTPKQSTLNHVDTLGKQAEHNPVTIQDGIWRIGIVREYDAFSEEVRRIQD